MGVAMSVRSSRRTAVLAALTATAVLATASPALALPGFGTSPVTVAPSSSTQTIVSSVTVGRHTGFDRVVFRFSGPLPGYSVRYVSQVVSDASGQPVPLLGSAFLSVVLRPTSTSAHAPQSTITAGFPALRQVKGAGDFEGVTSYGIGQASKAGFRAFTLTGPNRLVVDVAAPSGGGGTSTGSGTSAGGGTKSGTEAGGLASTGVHAVPLAWIGLALLIAGGAAVALSRRRASA
jgi:LPXTG-motif cell wall-anchored protein